MEYNFTVSSDTTYDGAEFIVTVNGSAQNLTGAYIKAQFKKNKVGPSAKTISTDGGITITDAEAGKFQFDPFYVDLPADKYLYDVKVTVGGKTKRRVNGIMTVEQTITTYNGSGID